MDATAALCASYCVTSVSCTPALQVFVKPHFEIPWSHELVLNYQGGEQWRLGNNQFQRHFIRYFVSRSMHFRIVLHLNKTLCAVEKCRSTLYMATAARKQKKNSKSFFSIVQNALLNISRIAQIFRRNFFPFLCFKPLIILKVTSINVQINISIQNDLPASFWWLKLFHSSKKAKYQR